MIYLGIDYHKSHSTITGVDEKGKLLDTKKIWNAPEEIRQFIKYIGMDSHTLAQLLRTDLIYEVYVPPREIRMNKEIIRYRTFLVVMRTKIKNRIHVLIERNHIASPNVTDLFGKYGMEFLRRVDLPESERRLLNMHLEVLDFLNSQIKEMEKWMGSIFNEDKEVKLLTSIPGVGKVFAPLIALEISDIRRFKGYEKLWAYAGLVPSTYASGNKVHYGRLIKHSNKWLRWAFIEASHSAANNSPYFNKHYLRIRNRKGAPTGIVALARKLAKVVYLVLKEEREYREIGNPDCLHKKLASEGSGQE